MKGYLVFKSIERETLENKMQKIKNNLIFFDSVKTETVKQAASIIAKFWRVKVEIVKRREILR